MNKIDQTAPTRTPTPSAGVRTLWTELPWLGAVVAGLVALIWINRGDSFTLNIIAMTFLFAGLATSWNIIGGFGGQFSLCHGVFFAVGAYAAANMFIRWQISPWIALLPAMALAAVCAVIISWPAFRLRGPFFAIATMAFNEVVHVLANTWESVTGGPRGLTVPLRLGLENMIFRDRMSYAVLQLGFLVVCLLVSLVVLRSRLGYQLQAVRENETAAEASGIDILTTKLTGMAISAALTAAGGVLFTMQVRIIDPPTLFTLPEIGVKFALIALIGGIGTPWGPLVGALLVIPLENRLRAELGAWAPGSHLVLLGTVLVLAALFFKHGLVGTGTTLLARIATWRKDRT